MDSVPGKRDSRRRLPDCMGCVLDHMAPGLPPLPHALLIRYARYAHDAGCGIWPGLRLLSRELRVSPVTLRKARDWLQARGLIQRLPRAGPHGTDLIRLGTCDDCRQRDSMQSRCTACQRANLQHAETAWWDAQRDSMQSQKPVVKGEPIENPVSSRRRPPAASPNGDGRNHPAVSGQHTLAHTAKLNPGASEHPPNGHGRAGTDAGSRTPSSARQQAAEPPFQPSPARKEPKPQQPARQATAGAIIPFKARSSDAGARAGAARTGSKHPPGAATRETFSHPMEAAGRYR
jgi:hypothetical protein